MTGARSASPSPASTRRTSRATPGVVALAMAVPVALRPASPRVTQPVGALSAPAASVRAALAGLERQANRLLDGGPAAFKARLAQLRGVPIVVNQWASWRGPCRYLDITTHPAGTDGYADLRRGAHRQPLANGLHIEIAALEDIIRSKTAAGRAKDLATLPQPRAALERRQTANDIPDHTPDPD